MRAKVWNFLFEEDGATAVEYAVMLALILAVCIAAIGTVGRRSSDMWGGNSQGMQDAMKDVQ